MVAATYLTIWAALTLFAVAEMGRAGRRSWARTASAVGLAFALVHAVLAFDVFHQWSHADAVLATARQTEDVFGVAFGAGVHVNYVFFAAWLVDVILWRPAWPPSMAVRALRGFYLIIIFNGAIVFASGWRRVVGGAIVVALLLAWMRADLFARRAGR